MAWLTSLSSRALNSWGARITSCRVIKDEGNKVRFRHFQTLLLSLNEGWLADWIRSAQVTREVEFQNSGKTITEQIEAYPNSSVRFPESSVSLYW